MINVEIQWAIQIILLLSIKKDAMTLKELSLGIHIPERMLNVIVFQLHKAGILKILQSQETRYQLRDDATHITMNDILCVMNDMEG